MGGVRYYYMLDLPTRSGPFDISFAPALLRIMRAPHERKNLKFPREICIDMSYAHIQVSD